MSTDCWVGIDLGTSGCRSCAIDSQGQLLALINAPYPSALKQTEQDPAHLWQHVKQCLARLTESLENVQIHAICVDATSGSVMLASDKGTPCSSLLLYNDKRATSEARSIRQIAPKNSAAHGVSSGIAKLLWLENQQPLSGDFYLLHQADWINYQLGGFLAVTDSHNALKSGYDPVNECWPTWLEQLKLRAELPGVVMPGSYLGRMSAELAQELNLKTVPAIHAGTTDSNAAFIATGASNTGDAVTVLGSTLVLKLLAEHPVFDESYGIYSHRLGNKWLVSGASNTGGQVLSHYFSQQQIDLLSQQINVAEGAPDYYPLLQPGERFPQADAEYRPRLSPRPANDVTFLHGLFTSMSRIEMQGYRLLSQLSQTPLQQILTTGGGSQNQIWQTIRQQLFDVPVVRAPQTEAAYGAAILARDGLSNYQR